MKYGALLRAGVRRHKGSLLGIFILVFLVSLSLGTVLTVWTCSGGYIRSELKRAGFGNLTAWVSGADITALSLEIASLPEVDKVDAQQLIFSNYKANGQDSDSEGQLIILRPGETRYRFFTDDLLAYRSGPQKIAPGEIYVSPSMTSMFGIKPGDSIVFPIARAGGDARFTVKGFYEDPFMGSSMIGMKGFLICQSDYEHMKRVIAGSGIDALAREGAMLHILSDHSLTADELSGVVSQNTGLRAHAEFIHSAGAVGGFMLILQNAFSGLLIAFVLVLLAVVFVVLGHSIGSSIDADGIDMGILKTVGFTGGELRRVQLLQYAAGILPGMALGLIFTAPLSRFISGATLTTTGVRFPAKLPMIPCAAAFAAILLALAAFIALKTAPIGRIAPMKAICGAADGPHFSVNRLPAIRGTHLSLHLAGRQLLTGTKNYISAGVVALLLVFFASMIGRMNGWLGPDGKGMMDAFNPADHDIGVQTFGALSQAQAQAVIRSYTDVEGGYLLAMQGVSVNGVDYTANVISEPERFHILRGRTCLAEDEIVITESIAADRNVSIGDRLTVTGDSGSETYVISGIYSCANDMGANVGLSREGYLRIGKDDPRIWCHHYFLTDPAQKAAVTGALEASFGGDVHVHENTWPGLLGIILAMRMLVIFMYGMVAAFILIVTVMTGSKLLAAERRDIGIYKAVGFTDGRLRLAFALRFGAVAVLGSALGVLSAALLTDPLVSGVMKLAGISSFDSHPDPGGVLLPAAFVTALFTLFAYLAAGKIKRTDLTELITQSQ